MRTRSAATLLGGALVLLLAGLSPATAQTGDDVEAIGFADRVVSTDQGETPATVNTDPEAALGEDDCPPEAQQGPHPCFYSMGAFGSLTVQFVDNALVGSGDDTLDLWVFEIGEVEPMQIEVSTDGVEYVPLYSGDEPTVEGSVAGVDIDAFGFTPDDRLHFVRLIDLEGRVVTSGVSAGANGADIDAVGAISAVEEVVPGEPGVARIPGGSAGDVARQICQLLNPDDDSAERITLSRVDVFADSLAGSSIPGTACVLFTSGGPDAPLDPETRAEIDRALFEGGQVIILGGPGAVSQAAQDELDAAGYETLRLFGPSRYETAVEIATFTLQELALAPEQIVVANGQVFADAVTVGAYARATGTPIVLTPSSGLHPSSREFLDAQQHDETVLVGGAAAVPTSVEDEVQNPRRVEGPNRMATAVAVATELWPAVPATGEDFVIVNLERDDAWTLALSAAPLAAHFGGPELGVRATSYPPETEEYLASFGFTDPPAVVLLGDLSLISQDVEDGIAGTVGA